ncbi:hypothetical protein NPIL_423931 [Nephila pilipes]|uniref:Uncharacterized protein n=1 Tax=Nephila pilipes TaxID=299642 RepID=A0A8X6P5T8_NEPPI|nr:hypothetical protein NPIL_423931 [Nephila pilipes]
MYGLRTDRSHGGDVGDEISAAPTKRDLIWTDPVLETGAVLVLRYEPMVRITPHSLNMFTAHHTRTLEHLKANQTVLPHHSHLN